MKKNKQVKLDKFNTVKIDNIISVVGGGTEERRTSSASGID